SRPGPPHGRVKHAVLRTALRGGERRSSRRQINPARSSRETFGPRRHTLGSFPRKRESRNTNSDSATNRPGPTLSRGCAGEIGTRGSAHRVHSGETSFGRLCAGVSGK